MYELIDIVDEKDNVIGVSTRREIHNSNKWHRGIHIFIFNSKGELLLQVRSKTKKYPNTYDCSVSEHVKSGEKFEDAAQRGLKEELNITKLNLKKLLKFRMKYGEKDYMISVLFKGYYDGKVEVDKGEIDYAKFFSLDEIKEMLNKEEGKFSPWTKELLKWYFHLPSKIIEIR